MKKYFGKFASSGDVQTALENGQLSNPYVAVVEDGNYIDYNGIEYVDYSTKYFTVEMTSDGEVTTRNMQSNWRLNGGEWNFGYISALSVYSGDKIEFFYDIPLEMNSSFLSITGTFIVYGNLMSMVYGNNFIGQTTLSVKLKNFFTGQTGLTDASKLILPATSFPNEVYLNMFWNCTNLVYAPALPSTVLTDKCYRSMFQNCSSLLVAPALPATQSARESYNNMFRGCSSLVSGSNMSLLTTSDSVCEYMYRDCTSLSYNRCVATDLTGYHSFNSWMINVSTTGTFVKKAGVNWTAGSSGIPNGWTVIEE